MLLLHRENCCLQKQYFTPILKSNNTQRTRTEYPRRSAHDAASACLTVSVAAAHGASFGGASCSI